MSRRPAAIIDETLWVQPRSTGTREQHHHPVWAHTVLLHTRKFTCADTCCCIPAVVVIPATVRPRFAAWQALAALSRCLGTLLPLLQILSAGGGSAALMVSRWHTPAWAQRVYTIVTTIVEIIVQMHRVNVACTLMVCNQPATRIAR